jgi:hypothetical protein
MDNIKLIDGTDEYYKSIIDNCEVIVHKETNFINATKACHNYGKEYFQYIRTSTRKKLINNLSNKLGYPSTFIIKGGSCKLSSITGTYVHQYILKDILEWCKNTKNNQPERLIVNTPKGVVENMENYILEVPVSCGRIDILTDTHIIEVKEGSLWKSALGQILIYGHFYPDKKMRIHLFSIGSLDMKFIKTIYNKHNVELSYEE